MNELLKHQYHNIISDVTERCSDISRKTIKRGDKEITVLFIRQLTDLVMLSNYIIKPIIENTIINLNADGMANNIIPPDIIVLNLDINTVIENLLNGMTIVLFSWDNNYLAVNIKKVEKKNIEPPELTYTLYGSRDCFTENLDVNLSLIRYRIKDPQLKINMLQVGKRTKAHIAVICINDIANEKIVNEIIKRINEINIDGIIDSGELQALLHNRKSGLFPQVGIVERSDIACWALLEGKVIIITEGSGIALVAPKTFWEFLASSDDFYGNKHFGAFKLILRFIALVLSFTLGSIYIALVSFHTDILPADYILTLAKLRGNAPLNAFTEILLLEIIMLILKEALLRIPKQIGMATGIVGAIIIGQAAIASNVFDPLCLIIVSLSFLSYFVMPDFTIPIPFLLFKFLLMVATACLGLFGFTIVICVIICRVISENSFGVAYTAPFVPYNRKDIYHYLFYNKKTSPKRPNFLQTKDNTRGKGRQ